MAGVSVNTDILRQCRENMALSVNDVRSRINSIEKIEAGEKQPTFKQLKTLSELYQLPDWVFICEELPEKYQLNQLPTFRNFSSQNNFDNHKIRKSVAKVEASREMILDFRDDMSEPVFPTDFPVLEKDVVEMTNNTRQWLQVSHQQAFSFDQWREKLEEKNIFIFLTSKFSSWSKIEIDLFRGLYIFL